MREQVYLSNSNQNINLSSEDFRFISLNKKYWEPIKPVAQSSITLVEGFFAASGHNYLLRTGMLAKSIQDKEKSKIVVLFDKSSYKLSVEKEKYQSFGINDFVYIKPGLRSIINFIRALILAKKYYATMKCTNDLLNIKHNNILFGDLIYDDILKSESGVYTISQVNSLIFRRLIQAFYYYYWYCQVFSKYPIRHLITTHLVYAQYGLLARVALRFGADVVETNDLMLNYLNAQDYVNRLISPNFHSLLKMKIWHRLKGAKDSDDLVSYAEEDLGRRLNGGVDQFDARFAYKNKIRLSKEEFYASLKLPPDEERSIVVIFAHIFCDAPHSSNKLLFRDYYDWLEQTLEFVKTIQNIIWVVKPHPSTNVYKEEGVVEKLINKALEKYRK